MIFLVTLAAVIFFTGMAWLGVHLWWSRSLKAELARVDRLMKLGKGNDAEWLLLRLTQRYPDRIEIYRLLAERARERRRFLNMAMALGRISALSPNDREARYSYRQALLQAGQYQDVIALLGGRRDELDFRERVLLLRALAFVGRNDDAQTLLKRLEKKPEAKSEPYRDWFAVISAVLDLNRGDWMPARDIFLKYAGPEEQNSETRWCANFALGEIAERQNDPPAAETYYKAAFALQPELTAYQLGRFYRARGEYAQAAYYLEQELEFNPYKRLATADLAEIYAAGDQLDALRKLRGSLKAENKLDLETGYYCDALLAYMQGSYDRLDSLLSLCVSFQSRRLYQLMKFAVAARSDDFAALDAAGRMLLGTAPDRVARTQMAAMLWPLLEKLNRENRIAAAGKVAQMILPLLAPETPEAQIARLTEMGSRFAAHDYGMARRMAAQVLQRQPESEPALAIMARSLLAIRQYAESLVYFKRLPAKREYLLGMAEAMSGSGDATGAEKLCRELYERNPADPGVIEVLSGILLQSGDFAGAEGLFEQLPDTPENRYAQTLLKARIADRMGRKEQALQCYREALAILRLLPETTEIRLRRAELMARCGDHDAALKEYEQLRKSYPNDPGIPVAMSEIHAKLGRYEAALTLATQAVALDPADPAARACLDRRAVEAERPALPKPPALAKPPVKSAEKR